MLFVPAAMMTMAVAFFQPPPAAMGWTPARALSNSTLPARIRYNFGRPIAVDGAGVVHTAWLEVAAAGPDGQDTGRVMYARSGNDGHMWSTPLALSAVRPATGHPRVAASGPHVYVAWHGVHDGTLHAHLLHSGNHGGSWDPVQIVSDHPAGASFPSLAACGEAIHVVWPDARTGASEIYLRSSPDAGRNWNVVRGVSANDGRSSWTPSVACRGAQVHVAWSDERHNVSAPGQPFDCGLAKDASRCREEEYYRRSTDFGESWEPEVRLTHDGESRPHPSWAPSIAVWDDNVHVVFFDGRTEAFRVYYKRSTGGGAAHTWEPERLIAPDADRGAVQARPVIAALGPFLHVVWFGITPGVGVDAWYAASSDNGGTFDAPMVLTRRASHGEAHPSVAVSAYNAAHVVWYEADAHGVDQVVHRARRPARRAPSPGPWN